MMDVKDTLPDLPSDLILLALSDLEFIESDDNYNVDMNTWYYNDTDNACLVCFAGAVMANNLNVDSQESICPALFIDSIAEKLYALNVFRIGDVRIGLDFMNIGWDQIVPEYLQVTPYETDEIKFKDDMREMAEILKEHNL